MREVEEYRAQADRCEKLAQEASDPEVKRLFTDFAREWRAMADRIGRSVAV
jgi:hypothetical protein